VKARIRRPVQTAILQHVVAAYPDEACGILLGKAGVNCDVTEAHPCKNLNEARARDRYQIDPKEQLRIERDARERGLDVLGYFHSHPDHPAQPSHTDLALSWEEVLYVIVAVDAGKPGDFNGFLRPDGSPEFFPVPLDFI